MKETFYFNSKNISDINKKKINISEKKVIVNFKKKMLMAYLHD